MGDSLRIRYMVLELFCAVEALKPRLKFDWLSWMAQTDPDKGNDRPASATSLQRTANLWSCGQGSSDDSDDDDARPPSPPSAPHPALGNDSDPTPMAGRTWLTMHQLATAFELYYHRALTQELSTVTLASLDIGHWTDFLRSKCPFVGGQDRKEAGSAIVKLHFYLTKGGYEESLRVDFRVADLPTSQAFQRLQTKLMRGKY